MRCVRVRGGAKEGCRERRGSARRVCTARVAGSARSVRVRQAQCGGAQQEAGSAAQRSAVRQRGSATPSRASVQRVVVARERRCAVKHVQVKSGRSVQWRRACVRSGQQRQAQKDRCTAAAGMRKGNPSINHHCHNCHDHVTSKHNRGKNTLPRRSQWQEVRGARRVQARQRLCRSVRHDGERELNVTGRQAGMRVSV